MRAAAYLAVGALLTLAAAGCTSTNSGTSSLVPPPTTSAPTPTPTPTTPSPTGPGGPTTQPPTTQRSTPGPTAPTTPDEAPPPTETAGPADVTQLLASMTEAQRVGQLFMVGSSTTDPDQATRNAITTDHVGSVILTNTTHSGVNAVARVSRELQDTAQNAATSGNNGGGSGGNSDAGAVQLFVATDQEGGQVQRLQGPGFDTIPSATVQGQLDPDQLRTDAQRWGSQLRDAGVNLNLAPVMDTVPTGTQNQNPPIGQLDRQFGSDPATVTAHGTAVVQGFADAGIDATIKHFPGLGRVTGNTDYSSGVTDHVTTRHDAFLAPYAAAIKAGVPFVLMSTAYYALIDPNRPAAFSTTIVTGMLRDDLGFRGVVISDDLGSAAQVANYSPGARAINFIAAGGDMVLTVDPSQIPAMTAAVLARAKTDPTFHKLVDAAALRVLTAKKARGLL